MRQFLSVIATLLMIFWAISAGMTSSIKLDFSGNFKNLESSIKSLLEASRAETDYIFWNFHLNGIKWLRVTAN